MGLMLSVLVFCVGVVEALDCWHHFMFHLVQPQHNPPPYQLDLTTDILGERGLSVSHESRRTSHVNISWPRDLSPTDDLHVIKKRSHDHNERKIDHDKDSTGHHSLQNALHSEKDICHSTRDDVQGLDSILCSLEPGEASLSHVELGVIVESDTSSEEDESSQIENESHKLVESKMKYSAKLDESTVNSRKPSANNVCDCEDGKTNIAVEEFGDRIRRPTTPNPSRSESLCDNGEQNGESKCTSAVDDSKLPTFVDNILSEAVKIVSFQYASGDDSNVINTSNVRLESTERDNNLRDEDTLARYHEQHISSITTMTDLQNDKDRASPLIGEVTKADDKENTCFPQIMLHESSPPPLDENSDSSLNTSDASWMVRSRTSDRPLKIRLSQSPEEIAEDFISVTKTDLQAFANKDKDIPHTEEESSQNVSQDVSSGLQKEQITPTAVIADKTQISNVPPTVDGITQLCESVTERGNVEVVGDRKTSAQLETTSSSSSLSGIPQLPEDSRDNTQRISLPADNGYGRSSFEDRVVAVEDVASTSDDLVISPDNSYNVECVVEDTSNPIYDKSLENKASSVKNISYDQDVDTRLEKKTATNVQDAPTKQNKREQKIECEQPCASASVESKPKSSQSEVRTNEEFHVSLQKADTKTNDFSDAYASQTHDKSNIKRDQSSARVSDEHEYSEVADPKEFEIAASKNPSSLLVDADLGVKSIESSNQPEEVTKRDKNDTFVPDSHSTFSLPEDQSLTSPATHENQRKEPTQDKEETSQETIPVDSEFKSKPLQRRDTKRKSKIKPRNVPKRPGTPNEDPALARQTVESDEEDHAGNIAQSVCVRSKTPVSDSTYNASSETLDEAKPPSPPELEGPGAGASLPSKPENEENKANWLIFSGEYTKAMNKDWHSGHFCCWQCDESLTGQRYVLRDEHPYCIKCYESVFANSCEECSKIIGIDSKDLSYKDKHWHEACFLCNKCRVSLVDKQFGSKLDKIFCGPCYDAQFASRCDGCGQIFKAGTKKMEYKTRQWHEPCFSCCMCKTPIGTKSFIPREQEIYCATCYEEKFATRCVKCNKIITSGGVTYKNEPWHRECFTCTNCSTSLAGQRFTSRDEKPYCADCFGELFAKRCTACCKPITGIGGTRFISFEDRHWHNDCFICASCKTSLVGRGFITDAEDIICPECAKQKLM